MTRFSYFRTLLFASLLALAVGSAVGDDGQRGHDEPEAKPGEMSIRGEVLDMACYVAQEAKGPDHASCAKRCVKGGQPMGLLAEDGTVYLLYASHANGAAFEATKELAGQNVEIKGVAATQAGIKGLEVSSVNKI